MKDEDLMPFGKHSGKQMIEVPDHYLLWFWRENKDMYKNKTLDGENNIRVMQYIEDSFNESELP